MNDYSSWVLLKSWVGFLFKNVLENLSQQLDELAHLDQDSDAFFYYQKDVDYLESLFVLLDSCGDVDLAFNVLRTASKRSEIEESLQLLEKKWGKDRTLMPPQKKQPIESLSDADMLNAQSELTDILYGIEQGEGFEQESCLAALNRPELMTVYHWTCQALLAHQIDQDINHLSRKIYFSKVVIECMQRYRIHPTALWGVVLKKHGLAYDLTVGIQGGKGLEGEKEGLFFDNAMSVEKESQRLIFLILSEQSGPIENLINVYRRISSEYFYALFDGLSDQDKAQVSQELFTLMIDGNVEQIKAFFQSLKSFEALPSDPSSVIILPDNQSKEAQLPELEIDMDLFEVFTEEADELYERINATFSKIVSDKTWDKIDELKRDLHTFKGSSKMTGLNQVSEAIHDVETQVVCSDQDEVKLKQARSDFEVAYGLVQAFKRKNMKKSYSSTLDSEGEGIQAQAQKVLLGMDGLLEALKVKKEQAQASDCSALKDQCLTLSLKIEFINLDGLSCLYQYILEDLSKSQLSAIDFLTLEERLIGSKDILSCLLSGKPIPKVDDKIGFFSSEEHVAKKNIQVSLLDMESVVINNAHVAMLAHYAKQVSEELGEASNEQHLKMLDTILDQMIHLSGNISQQLTNTMMVTFEKIEDRLNALVSQCSNLVNKSIDFKITGKSVRLDYHLLMQLLPALEHIIRNCIDHGIESAQERKDSNKPKSGQLSIAIEAKMNQFHLVISDDGRGIDIDTITEKAIDRGLLSEDNDWDEGQRLRLILRPGFTTKEDVSELSGRGVGMDVVNSDIESLGGTIRLSTQLNQGTTFELMIPAAHAVMEGLVFELLNQQYALPLTSVTRVVRVSWDEFMAASSEEIIEYEGTCYQLRYLGALLSEQNKPGVGAKRKTLPIILLALPDINIALCVDRLKGSQSLLRRPFKTAISAISATSLLSDSQVVWWLNEHVLGHMATPKTQVIESRARVLVVDDSMTIQNALEKLLKPHYAVELADHGQEAYDKLKQKSFDLVTLDIDMPTMNGYEFLEQFNQWEEKDKPPVIVISAKDSLEHYEKCKEYGVKAVLSKPYDNNELLSHIEWLLGEDIHDK